MRLKLIPTVWLFIFIAAQLFVNCSNPLEDSETPVDPQPGIDTIFVIDTVMVIDTVGYADTLYSIDTVMVFDTIVYSDTLYYIDTLMVFDTVSYTDTLWVIDTFTNYDTLFFVDTISIVDTVYIVDPDSSGLHTVCGRIASNQKEIVWLLRNSTGNFKLEFVVSTERDHPLKILSVDIDGEKFTWNAQEEPELILSRTLDLHATITISTNKPPALGHPADICLTITRE